MKLLCVSDAFMRPEYYRKAESLHPNFQITDIINFGVEDRTEMRHTVHEIEHGGPDAVPAPEELYEKIAGAEALMVHLCPVTRRLLESDAAKNLKLIMVNRGGTENIDVAAATERGIPVLSNPAHNANAVAELTIGLMLDASRNISRADKVMKEGGWREAFPNSGNIYELHGLTVGLIGFGNIARRVAKFLNAFDCNIVFYDPNVKEDDPQVVEYKARKVELDELMSTADFISLHARPNKVILGRHEFGLMKPHSYFINTARALSVDYDALYDVLKEKKILGAALDVHRVEPTDPNEPLLTLDNITLTNHRGGDTVNSYSDSPEMMLTEGDKLLAGKSDVRFWINRDAVSGK